MDDNIAKLRVCDIKPKAALQHLSTTGVWYSLYIAFPWMISPARFHFERRYCIHYLWKQKWCREICARIKAKTQYAVLPRFSSPSSFDRNNHCRLEEQVTYAHVFWQFIYARAFYCRNHVVCKTNTKHLGGSSVNLFSSSQQGLLYLLIKKNRKAHND